MASANYKKEDTRKKITFVKKNIKKFRAQGMSLPEIARECGIAPQTLYSHLEEIARENGLERNDFLSKVHTHSVYNRSENLEELQTEPIQRRTEKIIHEIEENISSLSSIERRSDLTDNEEA